MFMLLNINATLKALIPAVRMRAWKCFKTVCMRWHSRISNVRACLQNSENIMRLLGKCVYVLLLN